MSTERDAELLAALQAGSKNAFDDIFREYYTTLVTYAESRMQLDSDAAEQVVQECFADLWDKQLYKNVKISLKGMLLAIVRNQCARALKNHIKDKNTKRQYFILNPYKAGEDDPVMAAYSGNETEEAAYHKRLELVVTFFRKITTLQCKEMTHIYIQGESYKETAKMLNKTVNTLKKNLRDTKRTLRNMILKQLD